MGTITTTVSGRQCQAWASMTPHSHRQRDANFPDGSRAAAGSYCRNPNGSPVGPWCLTMDPKKRWEVCDVQLCTQPYGKMSYFMYKKCTSCTLNYSQLLA